VATITLHEKNAEQGEAWHGEKISCCDFHGLFSRRSCSLMFGKQIILTMNTTLKVVFVTALLATSAIAKDQDVVIKCAIGKGTSAFALPVASTQPNREVTLRATREFRYPSKWDLPQESTNSEGAKIILPVKALEFERVEAGWIIECSTEKIEGGLIRVTGVATFTEPELRQAVHGEQSRPIYAQGDRKVLLTENKGESAVVRSSSTRFQVFALPGKQYEFNVAKLDKTIPLTLTCSYQK